jgi:hypothetical protein
MRIYDNTELTTHRTCPRKYYFRHVRNWVGDGPPAYALGFGLGIHAACDAIWKSIHEGERDQEKIAVLGFGAFMDVWNESGYPPIDVHDDDLWDNISPRTPDVAAAIIIEYIKENAGWIRSCELLDIEKPFLVPINPDKADVFYGGRWDKLIRKDGKIWILDHKTSSAYRKAAGFAEYFLESFSPNSQVDGYLFGGELSFPGEVAGVFIDAILVHKTIRKFAHLPITKDVHNLEEWLWEANREIETIERDKAIAEKAGDRLNAFPKNTGSCFDFFSRCTYFEQCQAAGGRPHKLAMPEGFKEEAWSPLYQDQLKKLMEE